MKNKISITALLLTLCMGFSMAFTACNTKDAEPDNNSVTGGTNSSELVVPEGDRNYEISTSDEKIVVNNTSDYKILIPSEVNSNVSFAALELQGFLQEACKVKLPIIKDSSYDINGKYFSLGNTALAKMQNFTDNTLNNLSSQGFRIVTASDDIYIYGATPSADAGVLYGVYAYLEQEFNYEFFYDDVYTLNQKDELPLRLYNIKDVPDFEERIAGWGYQIDDDTTGRRLRYMKYNDVTMPTNQSYYHNCFEYLPKETYLDEHPEWYTAAGKQLCYTAGGNAESLALMQQLVIDKIIEEFSKEAYKDKTSIVFAMTDNHDPCTCSACKSLKTNTGADSGAVVLFCNAVAEKVEAVLKEKNDPRADSFNIVFYAYFEYLPAPNDTYTDENGQTVDMKVNKHVVPYFAPLHAEFTKAFNCPENRSYTEAMAQWNKLADKCFIWAYGVYFNNFLLPYDNFSSLQDTYQYFRSIGAKQIFTQDANAQYGVSTGFSLLKGYLESKLAWDVHTDIAAATERFFKAMYGSESEALMEVYEEVRALLRYQIDHLGYKTEVLSTTGLAKKEYFPLLLVQSWYERLKEAAIRLEKGGDVRSAGNVEIEMLFPLFVLVEMHEDALGPVKARTIKSDMLSIIQERGMTLIAEHASMTDWIGKLSE